MTSLTARPAELTGRIVRAGDVDYPVASAGYNRLFAHDPAVIVFAQETQDVVNALAWARQNNVPLRVRSGRHSLEGRKRISVYGDTEQEALNELNKLRDQQCRGIPVATTTLTVSEYMTYWLEQIAEPSMRRTTYATYEGDIRLHIIPGIGKAEAQVTAGRPHSDPAQRPAHDMPVLRPRAGRRQKDRALLRIIKPEMLQRRPVR